MLEEGRLAGTCGMSRLCRGGDAGFSTVSPTAGKCRHSPQQPLAVLSHAHSWHPGWANTGA